MKSEIYLIFFYLIVIDEDTDSFLFSNRAHGCVAVTRSCNTATSLNNTYFTQPTSTNNALGACTLTVNRAKANNVCQIRSVVSMNEIIVIFFVFRLRLRLLCLRLFFFSSSSVSSSSSKMTISLYI